MSAMSQEIKDIIVNQVKLLRQDVTCTICLDLFTEPVTLILCQHTFCLECYKGLFLNKTSPKSVACPICKRLTKRRSYYSNEQFVSTTELINMYEKFLKSTDKQELFADEKYDAVKMQRFLDDCMVYKEDGAWECISLSSSLDDSDSGVLSKSNIKTKTVNRSLEFKNKTLKTSNRKVKALNTSKVKRKTPKKRQKKTAECTNNSEVIEIDDYDSPDVCQLQEDENKIVKLIEDDFVQNIENEYLNSTKNELQSNSNKTSKKQPKKNESSFDCNTKSLASNSSKKTTTSTGWSRMKTMKKQIKKKEVKYKQFNVSKNKSKSKSPEISKLQPVVVLEQIDNVKAQDFETTFGDTSDNNSIKNRMNKIDHLIQSIDEDLNRNQDEEQDIFSICTQKLKDPPKIEYAENKTSFEDTTFKAAEIDNEISIAKFLVDAQVHHSSTPVKILKEDVFIDRHKQTIKENICDMAEILKKSSEETDDIISATERTPNSTKQLGTRSRSMRSGIKRNSDETIKKSSGETDIVISATKRSPDSTKQPSTRSTSMRSGIKRNSDESNPVVEKKSSIKRRRINKKSTGNIDLSTNNVPDIHNANNILVVEKQNIKETTNTNKKSSETIEEQCVINEQKNIKKLDFVRNELKLFSDKEATVITAIQSSMNTIKAVLSQCSNYVNSESLFSESSHSKESNNSKISTNEQPNVLSGNFRSLQLPTNSLSSVEFYRTAIPCLNKVKNYYNTIISLSQQITDETQTFRSTYNDGKDLENIVSFKSLQPTKNEGVQTDNMSCPKCNYTIDFNSVIKPTEETTTDCFKELNDIDNISKNFSNESQSSKDSNVYSKPSNSGPSNISSKTTSSGSELILQPKKVNRQLTYDSSNVQTRKFKRIRSPTPESDSESSKSKKSNVDFSKLLYRNDIDIFFQSDPSENINLSFGSNDEKMKQIVKSHNKILRKKEKDATTDSQDSAFNYVSILEKEYKDAQFNEISKSAQTAQKTEKPNFDTAPNTVLDNLLGNINTSVFENVNTESNKNITTEAQLVTDTEHRNIDNLLDNINLEEFENDNFELDKSTKNTENKQTNNVSEKRTDTNDDLSVSMFLHTEKEIFKKTDIDKTKSIDMLPLNVNNYLEIENAEDKEVENLTNQVLVAEDSISSHEDLFDEDNIVESTPQKTNQNKKDSHFELENLPPPILDILEPPPTVTENLDWIEIAPPPPPEFQDSEKVDEPKLNNPNVSSITPDIFALNSLDKGFFANSTFLSGNTTNKTNKEQTQQNVQKQFVHSENIIPDSITSQMENQGKILVENKITSNPETKVSAKRNLNPIVLAQKEKYSPLQIIVNANSSPKQVISSTPKQQKSILSYMQISQKENNANNTNKNVSTTPVKQNKSNSFVPIKENVQIEVCESPVPENNVPALTNNKSLNVTTFDRSRSRACIACSRLKRDEILQTITLAQKVKAKYSRDFDKNVTHLIVCVDDRNRVKDHTIKYVLAIAHSAWIVSFAWVKDSLENNRLLPEEPYEVLDTCGRPGPKISRLTRLSDPLLKNFVICCANPLMSVTKKDLENAIENLGGEIRDEPSDLIQQEGKICLILTEAKHTQDFDQYQDWRDTFNVLVVDLEWLSRTIGQYEISSVRPFILCLEKGIEDLGYPFPLIATVPETPSQMTMTNTNH